MKLPSFGDLSIDGARHALEVQPGMERAVNIDKFIDYLSDRDADGIEWYFREDHNDPEIEASRLLELSSEVFTSIEKLSTEFEEKQICMGLRYLVNPSCGPIPYFYVDTSVEFTVRVHAISSMESLFRALFAKIPDEDGLYINMPGLRLSYKETCYMWWDMFPRHGSPRRADLDRTDDVILQTIVSILQLPSQACRESALHGLGHWSLSRSEDVEKAIRAFLAHATPDLKAYAVDAMRGRVQ